MVNRTGKGGTARKYQVDLEMSYLELAGGVYNCKHCTAVIKHRKNARAHARKFHLTSRERSRSPSTSQPNGSLLDAANEIVSDSESETDADISGTETIPQSSTTVLQTPAIEANPRDLLKKLQLAHGISQRGILNILNLLKLNLNFDRVTREEITHHFDITPEIMKVLRCRSCLSEENGTECTLECEEIQQADVFSRTTLQPQMENILQREKLVLWSAADYRKNGYISDCSDGEYHQRVINRLLSQYPASQPLTFTLNFDGVSMFEDSDASVWPFFLTCNEIQKDDRFLERNCFFFALWEGKKGNKKDPPFKAVFRSLQDEIDSINGSELQLSLNGTNFNVKIGITAITADTPAKADARNAMRHNGNCGCPICEVPGKTVPSGKGHCRSYWDIQNYPRRTSESLAVDASQADGKNPVKGSKGIPPITQLSQVNVADAFVINEMHAIHLGVVKAVTGYWLKSVLSSEQKREVEGRLLAMKPGRHIGRSPRSLQINQWKANEFRSWLFQYSVPCLSGILPVGNFVHWCKLVESMSLLSLDRLSIANDLSRARKLLGEFCTGFVDLYGENLYGINVHYLEHIVEFVELHGPLPVTSLFAFESYNGFFMRHFHGGQGGTASVIRQLLANQVLSGRLSAVTSVTHRRFLRTVDRSRCRVAFEGIGWKSYSKPTAVTPDAYTDLSCHGHSLQYFSQVDIGCNVIWSEDYRRATKKQASTFLVKRKNNDGVDKLFYTKKIVSCSTCPRLTLVGVELIPETVEFGGVSLSHIYKVRSKKDCYIDPSESLMTPCLYMKDQHTEYCIVYCQYETSD